MNDNHPAKTRRSGHRADLDELAFKLRLRGLTYREIGQRLSVDPSMAERRVKRHERLMREGMKSASEPPRSR